MRAFGATSAEEFLRYRVHWKTKRYLLILFLVALLAFLAWSYYENRAGKAKLEQERVRLEQRRFRVLVPLDASNQEYLSFVAHRPYEKKDITKKVSLDIVKSIEASKKAWFRDNKDPDFNADRVEFFYYPEGVQREKDSDQDSYRNAFNEAWSRSEQDGFDVVGVIGHVTSSATAKCGTLYAEKQLPMILPLATATSLTYNLSVMNVPAVLRLPPTNEKQTKIISDFLIEQRAYRTTIVKDLSNPEYSNDLIDSFRNSFVRAPFRKEDDPFVARPGQILAVVPAGGESGEPFLHTAISSLKGDALLLFAMTEVTLETLAQARASGFDAKYTVLTDGAVDEYLLPRANAIVADQRSVISGESRGRNTGAQTLDRFSTKRTSSVPYGDELYMTFPLEEPMPSKLKSVFPDLSLRDLRNLEMTHAQYVVDAVQIMLAALRDKVVKPKDPGKAREIVARLFKEWQGDRDREGEIEVTFTYDNGRVYKIDSFGSSTNTEFHLYHAKLPAVVIPKPAADDRSTQARVAKRAASDRHIQWALVDKVADDRHTQWALVDRAPANR